MHNVRGWAGAAGLILCPVPCSQHPERAVHDCYAYASAAPPPQVVVDVPRTAPEVAAFHQQPMQKSLERILYIWGIRRVPWLPGPQARAKQGASLRRRQCFLARRFHDGHSLHTDCIVTTTGPGFR